MITFYPICFQERQQSEVRATEEQQRLVEENMERLAEL